MTPGPTPPRDRLEAILEGMAEGVLVTDADGVVVHANRALRGLLGVGPEVLGRPLTEAIAQEGVQGLVELAEAERESVQEELPVRGRRVLVRVTPIEDPTTGIVAVLSDVTELRRLERIRRDFVANVSHELRTPVAAVRAATETLLSGALDRADTAREFVGIVDRHAERLHRLVEDLLELSRLESGEVRHLPEPVRLRDAVTRALELFSLAVKARGTRLTASVDPAVDCVEATAHALEHILSNLVDNAIKYSPEGATVRVTAAPHGDRVRLSVVDTGPGVEARHLPRLFERFYRADKSRSRDLGGTGLGLAIVKHLAEAIGATVSVESTPGEGTSFHVDLRPSAGPAAEPSRDE
ncbi:MAG: PAS domain-containing protein [Deltaproteobacteria bacterium]|nr:PAS domain-containing protein [Deltaproteobacteria bacterium]